MKLNQVFRSKWVPVLAFVYLSLPVMIFLLGWVKCVVSIPVCLAIVYSLIRSIQNAAPSGIRLTEHKSKLFVLLAILLVWVLLAGIGGVAWQNRWDHMYRNAIFHDLVRYDWPVVNLQQADPRTLCYYLGFWLPSALIGKLFGDTAGYLFQIVWAYFGVVLSFGLLSEFVKNVSFKTVLFLLFFSGLDILPFVFYQLHAGNLSVLLPMLLHGDHIELSLYQFNASSNTTLLFWLYNQTIPFWVGFLLLLREQNNRNRLFTYMLLLLFAPFPTLALAPLLVYQFLQQPSSECNSFASRAEGLLHSAVTVENATGLIACALLALYFAGNASANHLHLLTINTNTLVHFGLYLATEFLVYLAFVSPQAKKDKVLWILFSTMLVFSFVQMGKSYDFAWRTSIPASFYLMLLLLRWLQSCSASIRWKKWLFALVFLIGCVTPLMEFVRTTENTFACYSGVSQESLTSDAMNSIFDQTEDPFYENFIGKPDSLFSQYLQKDLTN